MFDRLDRLERRVDQVSLLLCQLLKEPPGPQPQIRSKRVSFHQAAAC